MLIQVQALRVPVTEEEIKSVVPPEKLVQLSGTGVIQAFTLAQEGESRPRVIGTGTTVLHWTKAVVRRVKDFFTKSVQFFVGHNSDNSTAGRKSVGETLASFVKEIDGKLSTVVVGYFPNKDEVEKLDVCSMEADVEMTSNGIVNDIKSLTGIALGSSKKDSPAFAGAKRLAVLQCFNKSGEDDEDTPPPSGEEETIVTFEELKKGVRDLNVMPWQLYSEEDIRNDRVLGQLIADNAEIAKANKALTDRVAELEKTNSDLVKKGQTGDAKDRLEKIIPEGATKNQKAYIMRQFKPEAMEDLSDASLKKFVDDATSDYADVAKLLGVAQEDTSASDDEDGSGGEPNVDPVAESLKELVGETDG